MRTAQLKTEVAGNLNETATKSKQRKKVIR